jgi:ketosteroid isomerase-like protein
MLRLNHLALCVLALLPMAAVAQTATPSTVQTETASVHHSEEAAIEQVMKQFHDAVVAHDGAALSGLFLPDANIWLNVLTDAAYDRAQAKAANTSKVRASSYRDFAKFVSTTPKALDPEHSNIVIHTDGTIAAVYRFCFQDRGERRKPRQRDLAVGQSDRGLADRGDLVFVRSSRAVTATGIRVSTIPAAATSASSPPCGSSCMRCVT